MDRRDFIKSSALALTPAILPKLAFAANGQPAAHTLIVVFQRGGADGLTLVPPLFDPHYFDLRPQLALRPPGGTSTDALDLDGDFGIHPAMSSLHSLYHQGRLAIVHAIGGLHGSRSHFDAMALMESGQNDKTGSFEGWINRHLQQQAMSAPFSAIGFGTAVQSALLGVAPALGMANLGSFDLLARDRDQAALKAGLPLMYAEEDFLDQQVRQALTAVEALKQVNPQQYPPQQDASYPASEFGQSLLQLAQLIKADVGLQFACVDTGGWDHHDSQAQIMPALAADLSDSLAAFDQDLGSMMDNVTVLVMTEFGRRAYENASLGTDHGLGSVLWALGGKVAGGQVYADWPGLGPNNLVEGDLAVTTDYRDVLSEVLQKRFGNTNINAVFPDYAGGPDIGLLI